MDSENVIKAWECCNPFNRKCNECPYEKDCYHDGISRYMVADAIALLKDREPVEAELEGGGSNWWYVCGECHGAIDDMDSYCRHCGRKVKWNA